MQATETLTSVWGRLTALRPRLVQHAQRHPVWVLCALPALLLSVAALFTPELAWLDGRLSLVWWCVGAGAIAGFAGGYVATERSPRSRSGALRLALALFSFVVYALWLESVYLSEPDDVERLYRWLWPSVPLTICLWALAATTIARETEREGRRFEPALRREWTWFAGIRKHDRARQALKLALYLTTVVVAAGGSIFGGSVWRWPEPGVAVSAAGDGWQGYTPQVAWYLRASFALWACGVSAAAALYLWHAFRCRKPDLPREVYQHALYGQFAGFGALLATVALTLAAVGRLAAAPVLAAALAMGALVYVLLILHASARARRQHLLLRPSLLRRETVSLLAIVFALSVSVVATDASPFAAAMLAGLLAAVLPLGLPFQESLHGVGWRRAQRPSFKLVPLAKPLEPAPAPPGEDEPGVIVAKEPLLMVSAPELASSPGDPPMYFFLNDSDALALRGLLVDGEEPETPLPSEIVSHWLDALDALDALPGSRRRNMPQTEPLKRVLMSIDGGSDPTSADGAGDDRSDTTFERTEEINAVIEQLFPGAPDDEPDDLRHTANEWIRETATRLTDGPRDTYVSELPSAMAALEAEAAYRHYPREPDAETERRCHALVRLRLGYRDGTLERWPQRVDLARLPEMRLPENETEETLKGLRTTRKQNWNNRVRDGCAAVRAEWRERLKQERKRPRRSSA